jgi:tRNA threonylcarbamoyladenosine biosynthesis protein TsaE
MPRKIGKTKAISKSVKETEKIAKIFLKKILEDFSSHDGASVIGLVGNLGAGKTTFMQAVAKHLGIKDKVRSPTFVIIKKYPLEKNQKNKKYDFLFHLDAYRLSSEKELLSLGWKEIIENEKNLVFVEWPQNVIKIIPPHAKFIHISEDKDKQKYFELK